MESQANQKYRAIARKDRHDGLPYTLKYLKPDTEFFRKLDRTEFYSYSIYKHIESCKPDEKRVNERMFTFNLFKGQIKSVRYNKNLISIQNNPTI